MVLDNILGLDNPAALAVAEERISKLKAIELYDKGILDSLEGGDFSALNEIHRYLFSEVYPIAG